MRRTLSALTLLFSGLFAVTSASAATNPHVTAHPTVRLTAKIDNTKTVVIGNTHSLRVSTLPDLGHVDPSTKLSHMMLMLKPTDAQEYALESLLDQQQDKSSPNYHQWMTPEGMGAAFGVASEDIATISTWLSSQGFSVDSVPKSARYIVFTGTSAQVESAFHTEMHSFQVDGAAHMSNVTDISIPKALTSVVLGVRLNDFPAHSNMVNKQKVSRGADGQLHRVTADGLLTPDTTLGGTTHYVGAADIAQIYDLNPLFTNGNDGTGIKIGILGQTDILLGDIATYRSIFGLKPNTPNFIQVGNDPGTIADEGESDLDVELSGAFAPGATIDFYLSGNSYFGGGIAASGFYVAENNTDDIMSLSYGEAESDLGAAGNAEFNFLWEQAAAQGISCFVSTGDSGPDTLRDGRTTASTYNVSGLASTPYNVAVGGTMFNDTVGGPYWSSTNNPVNNLSALSYIPELPWNEGALDPFGNVAFGGIVSESSGVSIEYGRPAWQTGPGIPTTSDPTPPIGSVSGFLVPAPHRIMPDVSLLAAAYDDGTLFCSGGVCQVGPGNTILAAGVVGGTSVAAPSMAGTQALIDQANGGRQGLPTYYYYRVAALQSTTGCNSATYVTTGTAGCGFHDIQNGNNFVPTANGGTVANGKYIGWSAGTSFDVAIGLGSPDVAQLATNWKNITFNATTTSFTLTPTTIAHGTQQNYTIAVAPTSGTGTPTGDVSIIAQSTAPYGAIGFVTLASGTASGTIASATLEALPAGTYKVYAHYAGDTVFGGSNSAPITVTVTTGSDSVSVTSYNLSDANATLGALIPTTTFTYGQNVYFDSSVCDPAGIANGGCSSGTPTGSITFTLTPTGGTALPGVVSILDSFNDAYYDSGQGFSAYDIAPTYSILPAGTYTVATKYSGDATFPAVAGTPFTIVIGPTTPTFTATAVTATIPSGGTAIINAAVSQFTQASYAVTTTTAAFPTGTVTFTDSVNGLLGTATISPVGTVSSVAFTTTKITTAGAHTVTAVYSGDANYATATKTVTITVGGTTAPTPVVTFTGGATATTSQVGINTGIVCSVASPATGTVAIYDTGLLLSTGTLSTTTHLYTYTDRILTAGTHAITCVYEGSTTYDSSSSAVTNLVVAQNAPTLYITTGNSTAAATQGVGINSVLTPTPENAYPMNPAPTGSINFLDGTTVLGSAPVVADPAGYDTYANSFNTKALKPGPHTLSAKYPGDANYAGVTSNSQVINIGLTTTAITAAPATVGVNYLFSITATVTPQVILSSNPAVGGTVSFYVGATLLGTATVTNGVGTLTTAALTTLGANSVTAVYSGDTNYYTSTSAGRTVTAVTPSATFTINPASLTIIRGQAGSATMTITTTGDFTGTLNFSCAGLPAYSYCNFPPTVIAPATGTTYGSTGTLTQTVAMTVATTAPSPEYAGGLLWIPALFFAGFLMVRRKQLSGRTRSLIALAVMFCGVAALSGCAGSITHNGVQAGTPLGQASLTVNVSGVGTTSVGSPNITASAPLTINVVAQ